jgi:hypothetical protein
LSLTFISYANTQFRGSQKLLQATADRVGGIDRIFAHSPRSLDAEFRRLNKKILKEPRGAGYWLWKPYIINRHLQQLGDDDWLFYCDSAAFLVESPAVLVEHVAAENPDVVVFDGEPYWLEFIWTKRDAFLLLDCDSPRFWVTPQREGGISLWRGTDFARNVAREWLEAACDPRAITDAPNELGLPNLPGFRDHRHDQSLLSLITKRHDIRSWRDPSQVGNAWRTSYPESRYPQILHVTRWQFPTRAQMAVGQARRRLALRTRARALIRR